MSITSGNGSNAKLGKGSLEAEAQKDAEYMDVEDDDDSAGFIRTSIAEEEDVVRIAPTTTTTPATDADIVDNNTSTKHALQKSRKGIVKIRYVLVYMTATGLKLWFAVL
ncbi:hypothetical protein BG003_011698 [Podila horticola]|nr:hypothetical protein BG003_011698 [Podila horticola]